MPPIRTPFPYTTLFRSRLAGRVAASGSRIGARALRARVHLTRRRAGQGRLAERQPAEPGTGVRNARAAGVRSRRVRDHRPGTRSEEHTSELQSQSNLVCHLYVRPFPTRRSSDLASRVVSQRAEVESVLGRYARAFTSLDAGRAKAVWPSVNQRNLERAFETLEQQEFDLGACEITVQAPDRKSVV